MLPKPVTSYNLFIDGKGLAGRAEGVKLPKLERQTEEFKGGGMGGPVDLDMGQGGLKLEFSLAEFNTDILKLWGTASASGINARLMAAAPAQDGSQVDAIEVSVRGRWKSIGFDEVKAKSIAKFPVEMSLTYYKYSVNGVVIIEIDQLSGKLVVDGTDLSLAVRQAIGLSA